MVENQAYLFLVFTLTGILIGILFDLFRVIRKTFKTSDIITYIEDVLFWILTGILILYNIWYFNDGEIRVFMFLGIGMGVLIYVLTLSNILSKIIFNIINVIKKIIEIIFFPIIKFFKKIFNILKDFLGKNCKKIIKFDKIRGNLEKNGE